MDFYPYGNFTHLLYSRIFKCFLYRCYCYHRLRLVYTQKYPSCRPKYREANTERSQARNTKPVSIFPTLSASCRDDEYGHNFGNLFFGQRNSWCLCCNLGISKIYCVYYWSNRYGLLSKNHVRNRCQNITKKYLSGRSTYLHFNYSWNTWSMDSRTYVTPYFETMIGIIQPAFTQSYYRFWHICSHSILYKNTSSTKRLQIKYRFVHKYRYFCTASYFSSRIRNNFLYQSFDSLYGNRNHRCWNFYY